ncbi:uncharacterized protein LOC133905421 [Phragmites australis]|uniref:uncharacterized protein LOC133905421 n=1 Tax=Phragmites australis TaxID=29695 RepID=UPI002D773B92|nr:uncharacterized protein LOC133905421 [Phragmites australis]
MGLGDGGSSSSWGRLAAEGCTSTGATMSVAHRAGPAASGGCVVNIYVNNNVQGVTNSVLVGSKVVMRDPGARVWSHRPRRGGRREGKKERRKERRKVGALVVVLLGAAAVAATVLCLFLFVRLRQVGQHGRRWSQAQVKVYFPADFHPGSPSDLFLPNREQLQAGFRSRVRLTMDGPWRRNQKAEDAHADADTDRPQGPALILLQYYRLS